MKPPNKEMCKTCPFRDDGLRLSPKRIADIKTYLFEGTNHFCHSHPGEEKICRGGRNFQLEIWTQMGHIKAPTDAALREAMIEQGVEPGGHI